MSEKKSGATSQREETAKKQAERQEKAVIWLGPAVAGMAMTGTVYRNGLTPQMQRLVTELPAAKKLLVGTKDAARVRRALTDQQSAESVCYKRALEYAGKGAQA